MSHYAKVLNGTVVNVIVAEAEFFNTFVDDSAGTWLKTSYNTYGGVHYENGIKSETQHKSLRKNYASIGGSYNTTADAFVEVKPFNSWTLNRETSLWEAPVPCPANLDTFYYWDEDSLVWVRESD